MPNIKNCYSYFKARPDVLNFILTYEDSFVCNLMFKLFGENLKRQITNLNSLTEDEKHLFKIAELILNIDLECASKLGNDQKILIDFFKKSGFTTKVLTAYDMTLEDFNEAFNSLPPKARLIMAYVFGINTSKASIKYVLEHYDLDGEDLKNIVIPNFKYLVRNAAKKKLGQKDNDTSKKTILKIPNKLINYYLHKGYRTAEVLNAIRTYSDTELEVLRKFYGNNFNGERNNTENITKADIKVLQKVFVSEKDSIEARMKNIIYANKNEESKTKIISTRLLKEENKTEEKTCEYIEDIFEYYEKFGYKRKDIIDAFQKTSSSFKEIFYRYYSEDLRFIGNAREYSTLLIKVNSCIDNPSKTMYRILNESSTPSIVQHHATPYAGEKIQSLYLYFGKKGIPGTVVNEAIKSLSLESKSALYQYFSKSLYFINKPIDPKYSLKEVMDGLTDTINRYDSIVKEKQEKEFLENEKVIIDFLHEQGYDECDIKIVLANLDKKEKIYVARFIKGTGSKTHSLSILTDCYLNLEVLKHIHHLDVLLLLIGYNADQLTNVPEEYFTYLEKYYNLETFNLKKEIKMDENILAEILKSIDKILQYLISTEENNKTQEIIRDLNQYIKYVKTEKIITSSYITYFYRRCTLKHAIADTAESKSNIMLNMLSIKAKDIIYYRILINCLDELVYVKRSYTDRNTKYQAINEIKLIKQKLMS